MKINSCSSLKITILLLQLTSISAWGQKYNWSVGLRMGTEIGMSSVTRVAKKSSVEGILQYSNLYHSTRLHAMWREHLGLLGRRFNLYIGGGPGMSWYHNENLLQKDRSAPHVGVVAGLELVIGKLHLSWDYKPVYSFGGPRTFFSETALSLRYIIIKKKWRPFKKDKTFWERIF